MLVTFLRLTFLDEVSAYAQPTDSDNIFHVPKIKCVSCAYAEIFSKNYLKNVTNIWKQNHVLKVFRTLE